MNRFGLFLSRVFYLGFESDVMQVAYPHQPISQTDSLALVRASPKIEGSTESSKSLAKSLAKSLNKSFNKSFNKRATSVPRPWTRWHYSYLHLIAHGSFNSACLCFIRS